MQYFLFLFVTVAIELFLCAFFPLNCRFACPCVGGMQALTAEYEVWSNHPVESGTTLIQYMMTQLIPMSKFT